MRNLQIELILYATSQKVNLWINFHQVVLYSNFLAVNFYYSCALQNNVLLHYSPMNPTRLILGTQTVVLIILHELNLTGSFNFIVSTLLE